MDTKGDLLKTKYSVQLKFAASFIVLIAVLLILLNIYPILTMRNQIFSSKEAALRNQAQVMSSSLAPLDALTPDLVAQVMDILDLMPLARIIITDAYGKILYDTAQTVSDVGRYALFSEIRFALSGNIYWRSKLEDSVFISRLSMPVKSGGVTIGSVYLYEHDSTQVQILTQTQSQLRNLTIAVSAVAAIIVLIFTRGLTIRITELAKAFRRVSDGEYGYRINVRGNDELSELGGEFNYLSDRLKQIEEARRRFVSDASHELKTPLASIRLLSDSIVQSENMPVDTMREFVTDIGNESDRLQRTTEKLLSLTRLDSKADTRRSVVDTVKIAEKALHLLSPLAEREGITLEISCEGECRVFAAEDDIFEVVYNLTENGIKYNKPGGSVAVRLSADNSNVLLTVDDTGVGIPDEDIPHIFTRFYRVDKARSREAGGSGLGLSIVHDTVMNYGGTVSAEGRDGGGTRFTVCIPRYADVLPGGGTCPASEAESNEK